MSLKDFFYGIQDIAEVVMFNGLDSIRDWELSNWWGANFMTWLFTLIGFVAFVYWMKELKTFNDNNEEDRTQISHSFLGNDSDLRRS